ncbi:MAG: 4-phosphoerythronate dehydrogenase [Pseudomonadales bacterium]|nr:4-phosphoerythronate dehydrogenase [Pseudomonadales bacterium]
MNQSLHIVADENIPGLDDCYGEIATIQRLPGRSITADDVRYADILIVRSVTKVNAALLEHSAVRFVATCTIGVDHVDQAYLRQQAIGFAAAPGCNADAVVDYVLAALIDRFHTINSLQQQTIALLGYGEVGSRLHRKLDHLGCDTLIIDPFKDSATAKFDAVYSADVISIHTPLTTLADNAYPTQQLFDDQVLSKLKSDCMLINAARGPIIDNAAMQQQAFCRFSVLDVFSDEPTPEISLLRDIHIATPHIAGYSLQGKLRGTLMTAKHVLAHFSINRSLPDLLSATSSAIDVHDCDSVAAVIRRCYDIHADVAEFISAYTDDSGVLKPAERFDACRKHYPQRCEWQFITLLNLQPELRQTMIAMGFKVE